MAEVENTQDFVLENEIKARPEDIEEIDLLQEIVDHDFSSDQATDFDKYFQVLESAERDNSEFKANEADYIIKELGDIYLDQDFLTELNKSKENMRAFMRKHDVNAPIIKSMTEQEKDKVFAVGKFLNKHFIQKINELKFTFSLSIDEYKFIQSALRSKMSYDGTEVFNMIELKENYLDEWEKTFREIKSNKDLKEFFVTIDIRNVVMLYHFLSKYSVKGINEEFYHFVNVLKKISDTNKLFNAYNVVKERMNSEFFVWSGSITPMPEDNSQPTEEQVTEKPKAKRTPKNKE